MSLKIRPATKTDIPTLLTFIRKLAAYEKLLDQVKATPDLLEKTLFCEHPKSFALLAEDGKDVVGFAVYFFNYSTFLAAHGLYIEDIYVDETARGKGVGLVILKHLAQIALEKECGRMEWWVLDWNEPAIGFYKKIGAKPMDEWTVFRMGPGEMQKLIA